MALFLYVRFQVYRLWYTQRGAAIVSAIATLALVASAAAWLPLVSEGHDAYLELARMSGKKSVRSEAPSSAWRELTLPEFNSSKAVDQITLIASDVGVPVDEVTYALENTAGYPYRRYRISMSVKAGYPEIRKFVAALASDMPNASLDAIRCARENALAQALGCELAFSVFYR